MKSLVSLILTILLLASCRAANSASADDGSKVHVGIAYDSAGRGDKSFNDMAGAGLDRAKKELLVQATEVTAKAETDEGRAASLRELVRAGSNPVRARRCRAELRQAPRQSARANRSKGR